MGHRQSELEAVDFDAAVARLRDKSRGALEEFETGERERQQRESRELLEAWGVPLRVLMNLGKLHDTRVLEVTRRWAESESWCLVLSADKGVGKSTAAGWWLREVARGLKAGTHTVRHWWSGVRLARADGFDKTIDDIASVGCLVIDDLGVEYQDARGNLQQRLDFIFDERYSNFRRTIVTTNLSVADFRDRYGVRVSDRIREEGLFHGFNEKSLRRATS